MKILKVKVTRQCSAKGTHYIYPPEYDPMKIQVLCYESLQVENLVSIVERGNTYEYLIGVVHDIDLPTFLMSSDIQELTKEEALIEGEKWLPQIEKISNEKEVLRIVAKSVRGEELTTDELNVLDPDNPTAGITKSLSFTEKLSKMELQM